MWYTYVIKSESTGKIYVGSTSNVERRLKEHNLGENISTKNKGPWKLEAYIGVHEERKARTLEKYFKSGSGKAVLKKRILSSEA